MGSLEPHVIIAGGGNCGLAIATGLKKHGIRYTIFERESEHDYVYETRDWGMLLHWGTEYLRNILPDHLRSRMKEPRVDPNHEMTEPIPHLDTATGEILKRVPTEVINRVSRKKLRRFLTEGENLNIRFEKRLQTIKIQPDRVRVYFDDGTSALGSLVIGADGSHSKVREFLVGKEAATPEDVGLTMINFPYTGYTEEQARYLRSWHPIVQLCLHSKIGGGLLAALDIADPHDPTTWKFQNYTSWWGPPYASDLQHPAARLQFFKERVGKFCDPFRTAALAVRDDAQIPVFPGRQWAPSMKWDNCDGRVTLAGDAAHSMLPHRGQGLNNAMKDASALVDAIYLVTREERSLSDAVSAYEDEMRPRGAQEVALSFEQAKASRDGQLATSPMFRIGLSKIC